jgi:integrase
MHSWPGRLVVHRTDVEHIHDYAQKNCTQRDFLIIRVGMRIGLRTGEIATLRIEDIDFEKRFIKVLDSKKKVYFPLPLDPVTLQLIQDLCGFRKHGYVFTRARSWKHVKGDKPLTIEDLWHIVHKVGYDAGVPNFKPRDLRRYFAAHWVRDQDKSLAGLQDLLRHQDPETTMIYVNKLSFWEDTQKEFDSVRKGPIVESQVEETNPTRTQGAHAKVCSDCAALQVCKFAAQMPACAMSCCHKAPSHMIRLSEPLRQRE